MIIKYTSIGLWIAFVLGMIIIFVFPNFLYSTLHYNSLFKFAPDHPQDFYSVARVSLYATVLLPLFMFSSIGAFLGLLVCFGKMIFSPKKKKELQYVQMDEKGNIRERTS